MLKFPFSSEFFLNFDTQSAQENGNLQPYNSMTAWPNSICWERSYDKVISSRTATQWTLWWHCLSQEPEKWSGVFFRRGLKLWLPREILLRSHQLDSMWSPSPRPLSLMSPFLHSWNRTGSGMLREGLGCALHQHGCREDLHVGF